MLRSEGLKIVVDDLHGADIRRFLDEHIADMRSVSPPESKHALDLAGLRKPDITFWSAWLGSEIVGCGALKLLGPGHAEIKSMRTSARYRKRGVASAIMRHLISEAKGLGVTRLSLETGSMAFFAPARKLYETFGFAYCAPFADYRLDSNSVFMTRTI